MSCSEITRSSLINYSNAHKILISSSFRGILTFKNCLKAILTVPTVQKPELIFFSLTLEGLPKAAVVTHERVWAASFIQAACGVTAEDIFYINLPLYHSAGFLIGMVGAIERGNNPLNPLVSV